MELFALMFFFIAQAFAAEIIPDLNSTADLTGSTVNAKVYVNGFLLQNLDANKMNSEKGLPLLEIMNSDKNVLTVKLESKGPMSGKTGSLNTTVTADSTDGFPGEGKELATINWKASAADKFPMTIEKTFKYEGKTFEKPWEKNAPLTNTQWKEEAIAAVMKIHEQMKQNKFEEALAPFTPYFSYNEKITGSSATTKKDKILKELKETTSPQSMWALAGLKKEDLTAELVADGKIVTVTNKDGSAAIKFTPKMQGPPSWDFKTTMMKKDGKWWVVL